MKFFTSSVIDIFSLLMITDAIYLPLKYSFKRRMFDLEVKFIPSFIYTNLRIISFNLYNVTTVIFHNHVL